MTRIIFLLKIVFVIYSVYCLCNIFLFFFFFFPEVELEVCNDLCSPPGDLHNPGIEPRSPTLQVESLPSEPPGKPQTLEWVAYPFSRGSSRPRNQTRFTCNAGEFFAVFVGCVLHWRWFLIWNFPGGASGKEPTCQCRRHKRREFDSCVGKIP